MVGKLIESETLRFLKEFIAAPALVGAIAASSPGLAESVTEIAGVSRSSVVVEFGPGTGAITGAIVDKLQRDATFVAMEVSEKFVQATRKRFPGVNVVHDSAVNTGKYLSELGASHCDCIVSGLPWSTFNPDLQQDLLNATYNVLRPGGRFATFMYLMSPALPAGRRFIRQLKARFGNVKVSRPVWLNLPPAVVISVVR
ncbi:MAG: methyltransferase domain-containing protein [Candidatus Hydrogenedentes bacterium]|nr:methyltransferase domain-containing protein [Candidatus Hydrogenedentota bacterium]